MLFEIILEALQMPLFNCPECKAKISTEALNCPKCGVQIKGTHRASNSVIQKQKDERNAAIFLVLVFACIGLWVFWPSSNEETKNAQSVSETLRQENLGAYVACQTFVKKRLKAPRSAKFEPFFNNRVVKTGVKTFRVSAYVDSQNSFGAVLRQNFLCTVTMLDGPRWRLDSLSLNE